MEVTVPEASNETQEWTKVMYRKRRKQRVHTEPSAPVHYALIFAHQKAGNLLKYAAVCRKPVGSLLFSTEIEGSLDDRIRINTGLYDMEYIGRYELNNKTFYHIYIYTYGAYLPHMDNFRWMDRGEFVDYRGIYDDVNLLIPGRYPSWIQNNFPPLIQNWIHNMRTTYVVQGIVQDPTESDKSSPESQTHQERD
jgi:hypothetical protein